MVIVTEVVSLMEWVELCRLMRGGLSKDHYGVMYDHTPHKQVQISRSYIRPHMRVGGQPGTFAYDHCKNPPSFVWVMLWR